MKMKPPLQLIVFLSFLFQIGDAGDKDNCAGYLKHSPFSKTEFKPRNRELITTYINHREDDRFVLHCYKYQADGTEHNVAVITRPLGKHVVSIKYFSCYDEEELVKNSYMFTISIGTTKYFSLGLLIDHNTWCRFDINLNSGMFSSGIDFNPDLAVPEIGFFRWSEPGIDISSLPPAAFNEPGTLVAEYTSIGNTRLTLTCYKGANGHNLAIVKTTEHEKPLFRVDRFDCSPEQKQKLIQAFYVYTYVPEGRNNKRLNIYRWAGNGKGTPFFEYGVSGDSKRWLYYFAVQRPSKSCLWKQVGNPGTSDINRKDDELLLESEECLPQEKRKENLKSPWINEKAISWRTCRGQACN